MGGREEKISDDLSLHSVRTEKDVEGFASFLSTLNIVEGMTANCLLRFHPSTKRDEFLVVEETPSGEIVSSSCFIPWRMSFDGIDLSCSQVEEILTHPRCRKRGLVRAQFRNLHQLADQNGTDIVIIWGIPFYYRQFGYGYGIDGGVFQSLSSWRVGEGPGLSDMGLRLRPARLQDIPTLGALYQKVLSGLDIFLSRSQEHWRYLIDSARFPIHILEDIRTGAASGYSIHAWFKDTVHVFESGIAGQDVAFALLRELKKKAVEIQVNWPRTQALTRLAESLGSVTVKSTKWLLRVPDIAGFLLKIRPVLDRRIAASEFAGTTRDFVLNLFREAFRITLKEGRVDAVERAGFVDASMGADGGNLNIPTDGFLRLLFGQNTLDELYDAWPDIVCRPEDRTLVEVLFPRRSAYLYTPYHYYGPEMYTLEEKHLRFYV